MNSGSFLFEKKTYCSFGRQQTSSLIIGHTTYTKESVQRNENLVFEFLGYFKYRSASLECILLLCDFIGNYIKSYMPIMIAR